MKRGDGKNSKIGKLSASVTSCFSLSTGRWNSAGHGLLLAYIYVVGFVEA